MGLFGRLTVCSQCTRLRSEKDALVEELSKASITIGHLEGIIFQLDRKCDDLRCHTCANSDEMPVSFIQLPVENDVASAVTVAGQYVEPHSQGDAVLSDGGRDDWEFEDSSDDVGGCDDLMPNVSELGLVSTLPLHEYRETFFANAQDLVLPSVGVFARQVRHSSTSFKYVFFSK